jgi:hypothetical protein
MNIKWRVLNIRFENGSQAWKRHLKPRGYLVASEITWLTHERPTVHTQHWESEYPEFGLASVKLAVLEQLGSAPEGFFILPVDC